ncbi:MAG: type IV pilus twitching motility protein PilT [Oligoflexales bacterium]|nr:type IV pilus twitching motility protein PilT [Oligoflexales bacterium]
MIKEMGASDLHLAAGQQPMARLHGDIERVEHPVLDNDYLKKMLYEIAPDMKIKVFEETGDVDFAYELPKVGRFRVNFFNQLNGVGAVFRLIPSKILTMDELGLPPILRSFCKLEKGLVLVTGPTGSGKSTTLASMIDNINKTRKNHIITIEDPIEFVHKPILCSINHREVGTHTRSFSAALRGSLREDPDIILVGEMRDLETISLAIEAASTGHLVFGTLHTQSASKTVDRMIDVFPPEEQEKIRVSISEALKGVVAQALFKKLGGGRVAALEILACNTAVANLIREGKTFQITSVMQTQKKLGMRTLDDAILELLNARLITPEVAYEKAISKENFVKFIKKGPQDDLFD